MRTPLIKICKGYWVDPLDVRAVTPYTSEINPGAAVWLWSFSDKVTNSDDQTHLHIPEDLLEETVDQLADRIATTQEHTRRVYGPNSE